jgi:hypothetical protein
VEGEIGQDFMISRVSRWETCGSICSVSGSKLWNVGSLELDQQRVRDYFHMSLGDD